MHSPRHFCFSCSIPEVKLRWLWLVMISVLLFASVELGVSWYSRSLTLRADSAHMLMDGFAIAIALLAAWQSRRLPASSSSQRLEFLAALVNGLGLLAMSAWIIREAIAHWHGQPTEILSFPMLVTALLGLAINSLNLFWLHGYAPQDLNLRGVFLHILADLVGSIGALLAALAVTFLQWTWADTVIGVAIAAIITISALPLLWQSLQNLVSPAQSPFPSQPALQNLGWLEVGSTDLLHLIKK